jgi:hypothetical protein
MSVARASKQGAAGRARQGWAELREARWDAARTAFEKTLAREETPEAFEGLSWAAWWLDDAATVLSARERAYRLYKAATDATGAARMATWLAVDQLDFYGAVAVAQGWLARAHRLLDPLEAGPGHGWLAFHDGYLAYQGGDLTTARKQGALAAELGRRFGVADLEMLGLALADEAAALLDRVGASSRAQLCRARLALDAGEALRAVELLQRLRRQVPAHRRLDDAPSSSCSFARGLPEASSRRQPRRSRRCAGSRKRSAILRKLGLHSRTAAAAYAVRAGLPA